MLIAALFALVVAAPESNLQYGDAYLEDPQSRELPKFSASVGYGIDLNDSFSDLHSLVGSGQFRIWKYLSTGAFVQYAFPQLSSAGSQLKGLEPGLKVEIPQIQWAAFSLTQLSFLLGSWNMMNLFPLRADFMIGGGAGLMNSKSDVNQDSKYSFSYLWTVEQRFRIYEKAGIFFSLFGNTGGTFISVGAHSSF